MKKFCLKCGRKLNRGEHNWCIDCLFIEMKNQGIQPQIKENIWKKINEEIQKKNKSIKKTPKGKDFGGVDI